MIPLTCSHEAENWQTISLGRKVKGWCPICLTYVKAGKPTPSAKAKRDAEALAHADADEVVALDGQVEDVADKEVEELDDEPVEEVEQAAEIEPVDTRDPFEVFSDAAYAAYRARQNDNGPGDEAEAVEVVWIDEAGLPAQPRSLVS